MKKILCVSLLVITFISSFSSSYLYTERRNNLKTVEANNLSKIQKVNNNKALEDNKQITKNTPEIQTDKPKATVASVIDSSKIVKDRSLFPKEIFLTFDDGPSENTRKILKILDDNNIKATFFVLGCNVDLYPELLKAEYNDGMCILNHSYSHQYSMYGDMETCKGDFDRGNTAIKNAIGIVPLPFIRFPGGSDNTVSDFNKMKDIRNLFISNGLDYVDWNTSTGDAESAIVSVSNLENNIFSQLSNTSFAVTLMHDAAAKTTTVEALPKIIEYLKIQGFVFRTFNDLTETEKKQMIKKKIINRGSGN